MIKKIILILLLTISSIFANSTDDLRQYFSLKLDNILSIVQNKSLDKITRDNLIIENLNDIFDFELMGKLSIKKQWRSLSKQEQKEFIELYIKRMQKSYSSKLDNYKDQKVKIVKLIKIKSNRAIIKTQIIGKDSKYSVDYKFYKPKRDKEGKYSWLIYDVVIEGVSMLKNDIIDFREYLRSHTIQELLVKLKSL